MTISEELFQLADAVAEALSRARSDDLRKPLAALDKVCDGAERAWSGYNLGYHADVYCDGLRAVGAQFSPEWGLMERWPTHEPDRRWQIMDQEAVSDTILARAGIDTLDEIKDRLHSIRDDLSTLKEQGISLLTVAPANAPDPFLERKRKEVEEIVIADPGTIEVSLAKGGRNWSRDSTAVSQCRRIAAHQRLKAVCLSATVSEIGLNLFERAIRESASHMMHLSGTERRTEPTRQNVFIGHGHSPVWREFKDFIKDRIGLPYDEFNRVPVAGTTNVARLSQMMDTAIIAFLILTAEDEKVDGQWQARMNVVHEAGLFQGRLGFSKAIVLLEEGCTLFSNIEGLGRIGFGKGNIDSAFEEVRRVLEREGLISLLPAS